MSGSNSPFLVNSVNNGVSGYVGGGLRGELTECVIYQMGPLANAIKGRRSEGVSSRTTDTGDVLRNKTAVDKNASLELDELRVLAKGARELADLGRLPGVDRDVEPSTRLETGDEARHDRETVGAVAV